MKGITYEDMRPGSYEVKPRLEDMDLNHIEAALCFPTFPRFCGQTFTEAKDKELGLLCVKAYNDWMVEEWCGPEAGPPDPAHPHPAVGRRAGRRRGPAQRRARGAGRVLQRDPALPRAAERARPRRLLGPVLRRLRRDRHRRQHAHRLVVQDALHVRPTPRRRWARPSPTPTPPSRWSTSCSPGCWCASPDLKIAYSEGQIGWIPYILERADRVWEDNRAWGGVADKVPEPARRRTSRTTSTAASSTTPTACARWTRSARTTSPTSRTTRTRTRPGPTPGDRRRADGRAHRRPAPQDRPRQRHQALRPRPGRLRHPGTRPAARAAADHGPPLHARPRSAFRAELRAWLAADVLPTLRPRSPRRRRLARPARLRHGLAAAAVRRRLRRRRLAGRGRRARRQPGRAARSTSRSSSGPTPPTWGSTSSASCTPGRPSSWRGRPSSGPAYLPPILRRRGGLVPGVQRARRRQRPGLAAHQRRARRRPLRRRRVEDLDQPRRGGRLLRAAGPHRARRGHATAASRWLHHADGRAGHRDPAPADHRRLHRVRRALLGRGAGPGGQPGGRRRTTAGG